MYMRILEVEVVIMKGRKIQQNASNVSADYSEQYINLLNKIVF